MKILDHEQGSDEWKAARRGVITGTRLKDLISARGGRKIGFYELLAERLATEDGNEELNPMERGTQLEDEAISILSKKTGTGFEKVGLCISDDNKMIGSSPDALSMINGKYHEAAEVKCLSSARHLQAYIEKQIPKEYMPQVVQYFIVNNDLNRLYFCFYDPRLKALPFHLIEVRRVEIEDKIEEYKQIQEQAIQDIDEIVAELTF